MVITYCRASVCLFKPPYAIGSVPSLSGHTQLCTDGVHCRESTGTGPLDLKVVPVTGAAILQVTRDQYRYYIDTRDNAACKAPAVCEVF